VFTSQFGLGVKGIVQGAVNGFLDFGTSEGLISVAGNTATTANIAARIGVVDRRKRGGRGL
jgi:hypothetical protein